MAAGLNLKARIWQPGAGAKNHDSIRYGLRSLAPADPQYIARYDGSPWERDATYHPGTVWAWLMGPFITADLKVNSQNGSKAHGARGRAAEWLAAFQDHL